VLGTKRSYKRYERNVIKLVDMWEYEGGFGEKVGIMMISDTSNECND